MTPLCRELLAEVARLQAADGFDVMASTDLNLVGSAWFRKHGLLGIRWITTERRGAGGGDSGLVLDGQWDLAVVASYPSGTAGLSYAALLAEHVHDWPELSALATTILSHRLVRFVLQTEEYVERLLGQYVRTCFANPGREPGRA